jgi:hypothetical protein
MIGLVLPMFVRPFVESRGRTELITRSISGTWGTLGCGSEGRKEHPKAPMYTTPLIPVVLAVVALAAPSSAQVSFPGGAAPVIFKVVKVSPSQSGLHVPRATSISITFNLPVDPTTLTGPAFHVMGRFSAMHSGNYHFSNRGRTMTFVPTKPFSAGEKVLVNLARTVSTAGGVTLDNGFAWTFWTDSRASSSQFSYDATLIPGNTPYGAYGGDIDADDDLDICTTNENTSDVSVFLNDGTGSFGPANSEAVGEHCSPCDAADFNFDGNVDLAVSNIHDDDVSILFGNGDGTFQPQMRYPVGGQPRGLAILDADGDGDMDIATSNRSSSDLSLLINLGNGLFAPEVRFSGGVSGETGISSCDMDNDGILDLVVAGYYSDRIVVRKGNGDGTFSAHASRIIGANPWMVVTGDLNGDGWPDVAAALAGASSAGIMLNNGSGGFLPPQTYSAGSFPISIEIGDMNGDGGLDLSVGAFSGGYFTQYYNNGDGTFGSPFYISVPQAGSFTIFHDFDNDGDIDMTLLDEIADLVFTYRQNG